MGVEVAATCFQWSQPIIPHSPSSSPTFASAISSPSSKRRCRSDAAGPLLVCHYVQRLDRRTLFGTPSTNLSRTRSCEYTKRKPARTIKRACSASLDAFSEEEFSKKIQELALRFQLSDDDGVNGNSDAVHSDSGEDCYDGVNDESSSLLQNQTEFSLDNSVAPPGEEIQQEETDWSAIERKANSVDLPLSLRIIKRKIKWQEGLREARESACCSVKKAFSSMVFIIRELHSYSMQMREFLFMENLQGILVRVQKEMHASFVWLFQQVFSHTPTLMVYVMILLANFTVYSLSNNAAIAASPPVGSYTSTTESASVIEVQDQQKQKFDSSSLKTISVSNSGGKSTSIGGNNGGGGKFRPGANGTDGDGWFDRSEELRTIVPNGASHLSSLVTTGEAEYVSGEVNREEELNLWNSIVDEASNMQASLRDESLDHEMMERFVSPITANIEPDDYADYFRSELLYQTGISQEPNNTLLLANYAQFLFLVAHDYDRSEVYFKRAVGVEPKDAEAYSKYASFLWRARNDLWAAEETFLEAISADPTNPYHAANYANFLWSTGGEDTCFPLTSPDNSEEV